MQKLNGETLIAPSQNIVWIGISLALLSWMLESMVHSIFFSQGNLLAELMTTDSHEIWKRILVMSLLIIFSFYAQYNINMRRRAEAALQERERELTKILENNPAGIILVDAETRKISWASSNALKMIGSTKGAVEGQVCHNFLCPGKQHTCPAVDCDCKSAQSERVLLTANGEELPILKSITRVKYNGREHLLETFLDLSERKQFEYDLKLAHAELDQIFQTASVGMRVVDRNFKIVKTNQTFENMTGVKEKDAIDKKCSDLFGGSVCATNGCPLTRIFQGEEQVDCYVEKQRPDGTLIPCILSARPFRSPDGRIAGIVESFQDVSALKNAQETVELERDKLDRILTHLSEGVCIINADYTIEYQNSLFEKLIGDCYGQPCYRCLRNSPEPCSPCFMHNAISSGQVQYNEYETPKEQTFEQSYAPIMDINGESKVVVLLRDVTKKKAHTYDLMRAEQLAALGEMAAGVAHEINNPINGIINYAQILANKCAGNAFIGDIIPRMIKEGNRIARIVEGLLTFAQRKREGKTLFSLVDVLSDALALTGVQMRKDNIGLQSEIPADLPPIMGQAHEIEQVFINIIINALHALNEKYPGRHESKRLKITAEQVHGLNGSHVRVAFHDLGSGIPADIVDKVRNPFFSTKNDSKRTGLGLSISHGIVNNHRGQLKIESVEGEFTCVSVELPSSQASERPNDE